jgi:hypothetical protein
VEAATALSVEDIDDVQLRGSAVTQQQASRADCFVIRMRRNDDDPFSDRAGQLGWPPRRSQCLHSHRELGLAPSE